MLGIYGDCLSRDIHAQLSAGEIAEGYSIRRTMVSLVPVWGRYVGVVHRNPVPRDRYMRRREVQEQLPEQGTHPGVTAEVRPVAPATDDTKGLRPTCSSCSPVIVDSDRFPG